MRHTFALCLLLLAAAAARAEDYPHVYLKNEKLRVKVYLPDPEKGFYRGTRFDWAGVLGEVEFAGHKVFGPWKDTHDPTNHDDIIGPCEEFGMERPLGYDEAKPGETFLKIGVGELEKPKEEKYSFARKYKIVKPAQWKRHLIEPDNPWMIEFDCEEKGPNGYAYKYKKQVRVGETTIQILHTLRNVGTKPIVTDFYNHNFFNVDGDPVGPNYSFAFPFDVKPQDSRGRFAELVEANGKELRFKGNLDNGFVMAGLNGYDPGRAQQERFEMRHGPSGVRVLVSQTERYSKFNVWGVKTAICPEPFFQIRGLKPEPENLHRMWVIEYKFVHDPPKK
jgi:hypothetical protein